MRPLDHRTRNRLCSRRNAERIAHRLADLGTRARVIRTNNQLQPYRVDTGRQPPVPGEDVELEVVVL